MDSPNIKHVPINKQGCLELGLSPCIVCSIGNACYSNNINYSCYDICKEWKIFVEKEVKKMNESAGIINE